MVSPFGLYPCGRCGYHTKPGSHISGGGFLPWWALAGIASLEDIRGACGVGPTGYRGWDRGGPLGRFMLEDALKAAQSSYYQIGLLIAGVSVDYAENFHE